MRLLLIKTSSLGDIIHTFPALTDAMHHISNLQVDWVVEEPFRQIPLLHPTVHRVIPVAIRKWRKELLTPQTWNEIAASVQTLREEKYDLIIDAQGLFKSSILSFLAKGPRYGYNWASAREPIASLVNHHKMDVSWNLTALDRNRFLFAQILGYSAPKTPTNAGLTLSAGKKQNAILFLPGASWSTKKWPVEYWLQLAILLREKNFTVTIPWSTDEELQEALCIQAAGNHVTVLPRMDLGTLAQHIQEHIATVAVDSGLGYLSAAFHIPTIILWGPTTPKKIGTFDIYQHNLVSTFDCSPCLKRKCHNLHLSTMQPPCFEELTPQRVLETLMDLVT